ncbi:MAG TPA: TIGR02281 family clan AA aspartic protease [Thermohalobaculum sp.]|nr:TIGR02281 family clan AA aspartic protease [Thermohalobaculum sp.]
MFWWPVVIIGVAVLALVFAGRPPDDVADTLADMRPVYLAVLGAALLLFAAGRMLVRGGQRSMLNIAIGLGTVGGLATAFVFHEEASLVVNEIRAELMPSMALSRAVGEAELRRGWDGHYRAEASVNGVPMKLMIDTGASMVLIPYEEVASIGIDPAALDFSVPVTTANGRSEVAPVRLSSIKIGPIAVFDVPAAVARPGRLKNGLLGMSFLDRLDETSFRQDRLILRQRVRIEDAGARVPASRN